MSARPEISDRSARGGAAEGTRAQLVAAAEELFARKGVHSVALGEVVAHAKQSNASAVNYHFGDRQGLLDAVLHKHQPGIERRRGAMLDSAEAEREPALRALVEALVRPAAEKLDDLDGGRAYLRIMDQLFRDRGDSVQRLVASSDDSRERLVCLLSRCVPQVTRQLAVFRGMLAATQLFSALAHAAQLEEDGLLDEGGRAVFIGNLIDCIAGSLGAPVSADVRAAAEAAAS